MPLWLYLLDTLYHKDTKTQRYTKLLVVYQSYFSADMKMNKYCYEYPRPALSADCIMFGYDDKGLNILLIERGIEPYKGRWSFPGGFMDMDETIEECVAREMEEETSLKGLDYRQFYTTSKVDRDPRGRVVSVVFYVLVKKDRIMLKAGDDAKNIKWFPVKDLPSMGFDHDDVFKVAVQRLKQDVEYCVLKGEEMFEDFGLDELKDIQRLIFK